MLFPDPTSQWKILAQRLVRGLGVRAGELIQIHDEAGEFELLREVILAVELAGATPLVEIRPIQHMHTLWNRAPQSYLANWDKHRADLMRRTDRILTLLGTPPDYTKLPLERFQMWRSAESRLTEIEESRPRPYLIAAIPTADHAERLGISYEQLAAHIFPALNLTLLEMQKVLQTVLFKLEKSQTITIRTGKSAELTLKQGQRRWLTDDGYIDAEDIAAGAVVSNLPAGSLYTTVLEDQTSGTLYLREALGAIGVTFHFEQGRVQRIDALANGDAIQSIFTHHTGEPCRVGHIGIGLNPRLRRPIGWTIVDEHVNGHLFISFGENRYMGGENASSLNIDFALPNAQLFADGNQVIPS